MSQGHYVLSLPTNTLSKSIKFIALLIVTSLIPYRSLLAAIWIRNSSPPRFKKMNGSLVFRSRPRMEAAIRSRSDSESDSSGPDEPTKSPTKPLIGPSSKSEKPKTYSCRVSNTIEKDILWVLHFLNCSK